MPSGVNYASLIQAEIHIRLRKITAQAVTLSDKNYD